MKDRRRARRHDQTAIRGARQIRDAALDLAGIARVERTNLHAQERSHRLNRAQLPAPGGDARVANNRRAAHAGRNLLEQLEPFAAHAVYDARKSGRVAARPRQARDEAAADRIAGIHEHDREGTGFSVQRHQARGAADQNDVRGERDQFRRIFANPFGITGAPAILQPYIAAVGPTQFLQSLQKCSDPSKRFRIVRGRGHQHTDAPNALGLLRPRRERPRRRAAEQRDELPSLHSITSSARARTEFGISSPRLLAVLRLTTSSYLVGACTGRSAGSAPLRMRSTYPAARRY